MRSWIGSGDDEAAFRRAFVGIHRRFERESIGRPDLDHPGALPGRERPALLP